MDADVGFKQMRQESSGSSPLKASIFPVKQEPRSSAKSDYGGRMQRWRFEERIDPEGAAAGFYQLMRGNC